MPPDVRDWVPEGHLVALLPGDGVLEVTIEYITANSPVAPVVDGRIVRC
jgi:hypothetical protein